MSISRYWNQFWSRTRVFGLDSYNLVSAVVCKSAGNTARDVVVAQASTQSNHVAMSLMSLDREVSLLKYWGFMGYLKKKQEAAWPSTTNQRRFLSDDERPTAATTTVSTTTTENVSVTKTTTTTRNNVARIAFMITASQRVELTERLGYDTLQIKRMKPVEASLILEHDIAPLEMESELPRRIDEYNQSLLDQKALLDQQAMSESEEPEVDPEQTNNSQEEANPSDESKKDEIQPLQDSPLANFTPEDPISGETVGSRKLWFEVVETEVSDGSTSAVALYTTEEEAKLCMDLKKDFANRHAQEQNMSPVTTYTIRQTWK